MKEENRVGNRKIRCVEEWKTDGILIYTLKTTIVMFLDVGRLLEGSPANDKRVSA